MPDLAESVDDLRREVSRIRWWHRLEEIRMPQGLRGKTVLDVGAWDGFFSFEAERRGASRVLATDSFVWKNKSWGSKAGFDLATRVLRSNVNLLNHRRPAMAFYPEDELAGDPTSWWGPNPAAVVAMLKTVGFRKIEIVSLRPAPSLLGLARKGRLVVHAWR